MELRLEELEDPVARENFQKLKDEFNSRTFLKGEFLHFEIAITGAVTNFKYPHNLGFVPKDVLQTSLTGAGTITWNYPSFDATNLDITTSGTCTVRAFIGTFY